MDWQDQVVWTLAALWLLVALFYVFYFRLLIFGSALVGVAFGAALLGGLGALLVPAPFTAAARGLVGWSGLPERLQTIDAAVERIEELPGEFWDSLSSFWPDALAHPLQPGADLPVEPVVARTPGVFELAVLPPIVHVTEWLLRGLTLAASLFTTGLALALRSATATAGELAGLRARVAALEASRALGGG